jgi:hypothetical protein
MKVRVACVVVLIVAAAVCGVVLVWTDQEATSVRLLRKMGFDVPNVGRMPDIPGFAVYRITSWREPSIDGVDLPSAIALLNQLPDIRSVEFSHAALKPEHLDGLKSTHHMRALSINSSALAGRDIKQFICARPDLWRLNLTENHFSARDVALTKSEARVVRQVRGESGGTYYVCLEAEEHEFQEINNRPELKGIIQYVAW